MPLSCFTYSRSDEKRKFVITERDVRRPAEEAFKTSSNNNCRRRRSSSTSFFAFYGFLSLRCDADQIRGRSSDKKTRRRINERFRNEEFFGCQSQTFFLI